MKLLFICKHNRFRSKVAETIFNKLNKNQGIYAESAGIIIDELRLYIAENVIKIMKEKGYSIKGTPKRITADKINDYNMIVIVANNVPAEFFKGFKGKLIKWDIIDCDEKEHDKIKKIIEDIELRIKEFTKKLDTIWTC